MDSNPDRCFVWFFDPKCLANCKFLEIIELSGKWYTAWGEGPSLLLNPMKFNEDGHSQTFNHLNDFK